MHAMSVAMQVEATTVYRVRGNASFEEQRMHYNVIGVCAWCGGLGIIESKLCMCAKIGMIAEMHECM